MIGTNSTTWILAVSYSSRLGFLDFDWFHLAPTRVGSARRCSYFAQLSEAIQLRCQLRESCRRVHLQSQLVLRPAHGLDIFHLHPFTLSQRDYVQKWINLKKTQVQQWVTYHSHDTYSFIFVTYPATEIEVWERFDPGTRRSLGLELLHCMAILKVHEVFKIHCLCPPSQTSYCFMLGISSTLLISCLDFMFNIV